MTTELTPSAQVAHDLATRPEQAARWRANIAANEQAAAYTAFDAACKRVPSLYRAGRAADARHVLDLAAVAVCREVRDESCDLMQTQPVAVPGESRWTA